jgi:hypothetical protein
MERIARFYEQLGAWALRLKELALQAWAYAQAAWDRLRALLLGLRDLGAELLAQPWALPALIFAVLWLAGAWRAFKAEHRAELWALKAERHRFLKGLAYMAALPLRWLFALFTGFVEALVWGLLLLFAYMMWRVWRG